jgi:tyrosinase
VATVKDFNDISQLGYTYDAFEAASCPRIIVRFNPALLAVIASEIKVARTPVRLNLTPPKPKGRAAVRPVPEQIKALAPEKSVYLVLQNVHAAAAPGVHYDVYLDLPEGAKPNQDSPNYVGTINFFGVTMMNDKMASMKPRTFSLDVTDKVKALAARGELTNTPSVTLVPQGEPNEAAKPTIGQIQLVSQ